MNGYYIDIEGSTAGPFSIEELRGLYSGGRINDATIYSKDGAVEWLPLETIKPLLLPAGPSLPPPIPKKQKKLARHDEWYCMTCGSAGHPSTQRDGSFAIEILLWLFFIFPGIIYSLWRISTRHLVCPWCGRGDHIIPATSPAAREHVEVVPVEPMSTRQIAWIGAGCLVLVVAIFWNFKTK